MHEDRDRKAPIPTTVATGIAGPVGTGLNEVVAAIAEFEAELARVSRAVDREGRLDERVDVGLARRTFDGCVESVNDLVRDLTDQVPRTVAEPTLGGARHPGVDNRRSRRACGPGHRARA